MTADDYVHAMIGRLWVRVMALEYAAANVAVSAPSPAPVTPAEILQEVPTHG